MTDTPLDRIIKKKPKAPVFENFKRIKKPKVDTGEKAFAKQIDEILTGKKIKEDKQ